eukprot:TRINITY_DN7291_c0_g1_i2.p1 TRINITY_DN7291_c0_g1~~TRINITY_DN7291_c0_g1_i2.p1  ORF type:complete len:938 (-),score=212.46 TRINITY_DN7291_c0_g1_i2:53-2866(-)
MGGGCSSINDVRLYVAEARPSRSASRTSKQQQQKKRCLSAPAARDSPGGGGGADGGGGCGGAVKEMSAAAACARRMPRRLATASGATTSASVKESSRRQPSDRTTVWEISDDCTTTSGVTSTTSSGIPGGGVANDLRVSSMDELERADSGPGDALPQLGTTAVQADGDDRSPRELTGWVLQKFRTKVRLSQIAKSYARFVPPEMITEIGKRDAEEVDFGDFVLTHKVFLVCDIRGFTALSEELGSEDTFRMLNGICRRILPPIRKNNGYVSTFVGDAVTSIFTSGDDAVNAGLCIQSVLGEYNIEREIKHRKPVHLGVGLHAGNVMICTIGDNDRMDLSCIGKPLTEACQIEAMSKCYGVSVVMSEPAVNCISKPESDREYDLRVLDYVKCSPQGEQFHVFQVTARSALDPQLVEAYAEALRLWEDHKFAPALPLLDKCKDLSPSDKPTTLLTERVQSVLQRGDTIPKERRCVHIFTGLAEAQGQSTETPITTHLSPLRMAFSVMYHLQGENPPHSQLCLPFSKATTPGKVLPHLRTLTQQRKYEMESDGDGTEDAAEVDAQNSLCTEIIHLAACKEAEVGQTISSPRNKLSPKTSPKLSPRGDHAPATAKTVYVQSSADTADSTTDVPIRDREIMAWVLSGFDNHNAVKIATKSYERFLPHDFLMHLGKEIENVQLGDSLMLHMSVMFCETRITSLDRAGGPVELNDMLGLLNSLTSNVVPCIARNGGYVDKFFDDVIVAVFSNSCDAVNAGIAMRREAAAVSEKWKAKKKLLSVAIGINSGPCMLGTVGDNHRMSGTVIGNTVNVASRLLGLTRNYGVTFIVSNNVAVALEPSAGKFRRRQLDWVQVDGTHEPLWILEIVDRDSPVSSLIAEYHRGLEKYHNRDFRGARVCFSTCLLEDPLDIPSQLFVDRCTELIHQGVPADWTPVYANWHKRL